MERRQAVLLLCIYAVLDCVFSILPLAMYESGPKPFNADLIPNFLLLVDGYSFFESPIDLVWLSWVRVLLLSVHLLCNDAMLSRGLPLVLTYCFISWSFTIAKLLAFSENATLLLLLGPWLSLLWNSLATGLFLILWQYVLLPTRCNYHDLLTASHNQSSSNDSFHHVLRLLAYCKSQWPWFSAGFVFLLIQSLAKIFLPYLTGQVIANIVQVRSWHLLVRSVIWMAVLSFITVFFDGLRGGCFDYATAVVNKQMRCDLFRALVGQEIAFFDTTSTGEITSRLTSDCQTMSSLVANNLNTFLRNGLMLLGALAVMMWLSWRLTMVTFLVIPLVALATRIYGRYYEKLSERTQSCIARANHIAQEVMSTMRTVRSFANESTEYSRFESQLTHVVQMSKLRSMASVGFTWTNAGCDHVIEVVVLLYGGHLVLSDRMTADNLIAFLLYQMQLGENLYYLGTVFAGLMDSVGASRKVFQYIDRQSAVSNAGTVRSPVTGRLCFDRVSFAYPSRPNTLVINEMSLVVAAGETVALVGPSGGGKSSMVALLEHFYDVQSGAVLLDDVPVALYDHEYLHHKIALVAQEPVLYEGSVRHNILYGWRTNDEEGMLRAAHMANVHEFVMDTEHGYDTNCGEKGVQFSGGQKQRIAIARALVRHPAVLVLDEATSALDTHSEFMVQQALAACAHHSTVLVIAHRLSTVQNADRIIVIDKGRIVQQGKHDELLANKGLYRTLVNRQLLGKEEDTCS